MTKKTAHANDSDVERKLFGMLSYIFILCIVPLLLKQDDSFVHDHAK